jgi:hypothetical protein
MRGEDGVALVTAILVSMVVLILSASAVSLAIHNTDASGYDRRRLQAVDAAGRDAYYAMLNSTAFWLGLQTATGSQSCVLTRRSTSPPTVAVTRPSIRIAPTRIRQLSRRDLPAQRQRRCGCHVVGQTT